MGPGDRMEKKVVRFMHVNNHILDSFSLKKNTGNIPGAYCSDIPKLHLLRLKTMKSRRSSLCWSPCFFLLHCPISFEIVLNTVTYFLLYLSSCFTLRNGVSSMKPLSKEIVLCALWNRGKDQLDNLFHSKGFVTKVEMNENDWAYRPGLQIWKTAGNHWMWNGFNLLSGSQPMPAFC